MISAANFIQHQKLLRLLIAPTAVLAVALASTAQADYQQTLAARGADAFTSEPVTAIAQEDIAEAFASTEVLSAPALSDQEVMSDLHSRMNATDQLQHAAASLAPDATSDEVAESASEKTPVVASR